MSESLRRGAPWIIAAEFAFASMGAVIREASQHFDQATLVLARNLIGFALMIAWLAHRGALRRLRSRVPGLHLLRGLAGTGAMYAFFYTITHLPLADAMLLKLTAPLFIPFVALIWLREPLHRRIPLSLLLGFAGVALVLGAHVAGTPPPVLAAGLLGGLLAAVAKVTVRRLGRHDPPSVTVFWFAATGLAISLVVQQQAGWPSFADDTPFGLLLAIGVLATLGQWSMSRGFREAPAGLLAPFSFFSVVFGALLGWHFHGDRIGPETVLGGLLVLASVTLLGRMRDRRRSAEVAA